jgi:hypothetical protein
MTYIISKGQSKQNQNSVRKLLIKHSGEESDKAEAKRKQFLALLKRRYGYTNEKAVDELERILKQFYRMNRSFAFHRPRPIFKQPPVE